MTPTFDSERWVEVQRGCVAGIYVCPLPLLLRWMQAAARAHESKNEDASPIDRTTLFSGLLV